MLFFDHRSKDSAGNRGADVLDERCWPLIAADSTWWLEHVSSGDQNHKKCFWSELKMKAIRGGFFGSHQPARPFWGGRKSQLFLERAISEQYLSGREVLWTAWVYGQTCAQLWDTVERGLCFYVLYTSIHQYTPAHRAHSCVCWVCDLDSCVAFYA